MSGKDVAKFHHEITYYASAEAVYNALTDPRELSRMMRSPATSDPKVGGAFSYMDGVITGIYTALEPSKTLEMQWRMKGWADQCYSTVRIKLTSEAAGVCTLELDQQGIPIRDKFGNGGTDRVTVEGWKQRILVVGLSRMIGFAIRAEDED